MEGGLARLGGRLEGGLEGGLKGGLEALGSAFHI